MKNVVKKARLEAIWLGVSAAILWSGAYALLRFTVVWWAAILAFLAAFIVVGMSISAESRYHREQESKNLALEEALRQAGIDIRDAMSYPPEPSDFATIAGEDLPRLLREAGAGIDDRDKDDRTPLMWLAERNTKPRAIEVLVEAGADVNAVTRRGVSVLGYATFNPNPEVVKVLLLAGASADHRTKRAKMTPLNWAAKDGPSAETVRLLILAGANINAKDRDGRTALMWAVSQNRSAACLEIVKALLKAGAKINERDRWGGTALMWADCGACDTGIRSLLLAFGARAYDRAKGPRNQSGGKQ